MPSFHLLAARLKGSSLSAGAEVAPSTRLHLVHRAVPTPRAWYIARQTDAFHNIQVLIQRVYQAPHFAVDLTPPNLPFTFIPQADVQDGLGSQSHTRWKGLASILTALESLGIQQQQNGSCSSLAHSRSSRPPATDVQMHSRSDPISLGGRPASLHPFLAHLVTRSNPGRPGLLYAPAHPTSRLCDCNALVGWSVACVAVPQLDSNLTGTTLRDYCVCTNALR